MTERAPGVSDRKKGGLMQINISVDGPEGGGRGPVTVGWFLTQDKGAVLFDAPERMVSRETNKTHAKSAARCPAVIQMESRYFVVNCPYDLQIGFTRDDKGKAVLVNRAGAASPVRAGKLNELLTLVNEAEWRYPDRPTVQMALPYCFIADEPVYADAAGLLRALPGRPAARHDLWRAVPGACLAAAADVGL